MARALRGAVTCRALPYTVRRSTGILLNNHMDDFSQPGKANYYNLQPAGGNTGRGTGGIRHASAHTEGGACPGCRPKGQIKW